MWPLESDFGAFALHWAQTNERLLAFSRLNCIDIKWCGQHLSNCFTFQRPTILYLTNARHYCKICCKRFIPIKNRVGSSGIQHTAWGSGWLHKMLSLDCWVSRVVQVHLRNHLNWNICHVWSNNRVPDHFIQNRESLVHPLSNGTQNTSSSSAVLVLVNSCSGTCFLPWKYLEALSRAVVCNERNSCHKITRGEKKTPK